MLFRELVERAGSIADTASDTAEQRLQHRFLIVTGVVMSGGGLFWGFLALALGLRAESLVPFGYVALTVANFAYLKKEGEPTPFSESLRGPLVGSLRDAAREHRVHPLLGSSPERVPRDRLLA